MNILFDIMMWIGFIYVAFTLYRLISSRVTVNVEREQQTEAEEEVLPSQVRKRTVYVDIKLEHIDGGWYGWTMQEGKEHFVAQGTTKEEAMTNCSKRMVSDERIYVIKYLVDDKENYVANKK